MNSERGQPCPRDLELGEFELIARPILCRKLCRKLSVALSAWLRIQKSKFPTKFPTKSCLIPVSLTSRSIQCPCADLLSPFAYPLAASFKERLHQQSQILSARAVIGDIHTNGKPPADSSC